MMKIKFVKNEIRKKSLKSAAIIAVLIFILAGSFYYSSSADQRLEDLTKQVKGIQADMVQKSKGVNESKAQLDSFMKIGKNRLPTKDSYELGRERLKVMLPLIQQKKDIYLFKKLNFSLTEIKPDVGGKTTSFEVYENQISLDLQAPTDEYIFSFIDNLKNELPGYISIDSFDLKRDDNISDANVDLYMTDPKFFFVSASAKLKWVTLKEIDNTPPAPATPGAPNAATVPPVAPTPGAK